MKKVLYWAPRILGILSILFISSFSLDAFQAGVPISKILLELGMHLIPSLILVIFLWIAWKFELTGGIIFLLVSCIPFLSLSNPVWVNSFLAIPFALVGILFILSYYYSHKNKN
jgi:hypothetical protein